MNRVAVVTDIHANLPALEAALAEIDQLGVDGIYCGGDLVGYGSHPNEVCPTNSPTNSSPPPNPTAIELI